MKLQCLSRALYLGQQVGPPLLVALKRTGTGWRVVGLSVWGDYSAECKTLGDAKRIAGEYAEEVTRRFEDFSAKSQSLGRTRQNVL